MSKPKLLDQVLDAIRVKHYSVRIEEAYVHWIKRFILFYSQKNIQMLKGNLPGNIYFLLPIVVFFLPSLYSLSDVSEPSRDSLFSRKSFKRANQNALFVCGFLLFPVVLHYN